MASMRSLVALAVIPSVAFADPDFAKVEADARAILERLVSFDTRNPPGGEGAAATWVRDLLAAEGIATEVLSPAPGRGCLVARVRGNGARRPMLLVAHLDTVGFSRAEWSSDPLRLVERDGILYGRGVGDDKGMAAVLTAVLLALHRSKVALDRDVVLLLTADEEAGGDAGISWVLKHHRAKIDAEFALNEGGYVKTRGGRVRHAAVQFAEKSYLDVQIVARGPGGHSSRPVPGNPIHRIARALSRIAAHRFPVRLSPQVRTFLRGLAGVVGAGQGRDLEALVSAEGDLPADLVRRLEADAELNAALRTTCVATTVQGGSQVNVLPTEARANLNCRLTPGERADDVLDVLRRVAAEPELEIRADRPLDASPASPLAGPGYEALCAALRRQFGDIPIVPFVSRGATDSRHLRAAGIPAYGLLPLPLGDADAPTMHAPDERIPARSLRLAVELTWRFVIEAAGARAAPERPSTLPAAQR
jgi:acetylornithine deacetylase/succinyl-diaminopimelate desuccinylase-like protein